MAMALGSCMKWPLENFDDNLCVREMIAHMSFKTSTLLGIGTV